MSSIMKKIINKIKNVNGIHKYERYRIHQIKMNNEYATVNAEGITYVYKLKDIYIPRKMFLSRKTFSKEEIDLFFELSAKYYKQQETGIFLDLGANIGTTSVYVAKKYPNLQVLAFEPESENYKLLCINKIINDCNNLVTENKGLSNEIKSETMVVCDSNRGANYVLSSQEGVTEIVEGTDIKKIDVITLDSYFADHNINVQNISYIWIDTEGFEAFVIDGMMSVLMNRRIPMFVEISGEILAVKRDAFALLFNNIEKVYKKFIVVSGGGISEEKELNELKELVDTERTYNIFLF